MGLPTPRFQDLYRLAKRPEDRGTGEVMALVAHVVVVIGFDSTFEPDLEQREIEE